jgi:hypothetical protein
VAGRIPEPVRAHYSDLSINGPADQSDLAEPCPRTVDGIV